MKIDHFISDLLYRYDCVIVPNFGGFVTNKIGATVNHYTHTFYPPTKKLSFNKLLQHNDGLLANYIASVENCTFKEANSIIASSVSLWKNNLQTTGTFYIANVGQFSLNNEKQIIFEPTSKTNYLTESFGLSSVHSLAIERYKEKVKPLVFEEKKKSKTPIYIRYAATAAILVTLGFVGWNQYNENRQQEIAITQEKALEQKIQSATFVINNPLPTINLHVTKVAKQKYHIIAGAFQIKENADKKVRQLKRKGFDAQILGKNKWGLTQVAFASFTDKNEAINALRKIKRDVSKEAWLFISK